MTGAIKITKEEFYRNGGFANAKLFRKHTGQGWAYYRSVL